MKTKQEEWEKKLPKDDLKVIKAIRKALKDLPFGDIEIDIKVGKGLNTRIECGIPRDRKIESTITLAGSPKELVLISYGQKS